MAGAVGVSRATLYRLFKPLGGVAYVIQAERLDRAAERLMDRQDRRTVTTIAHASGFADLPHFHHAFRRRFGLRPSDLK